MKEIIINNKKFSVSTSHYDWWENVSNGLWEPFTFNIIDKVLKREDVCIDLGAWYGFISLYLAQTANIVYSIEPDIITFEDLKNLLTIPKKIKN